MVHQRQASILGELRRFSVLAGTLARLIHLLGTGCSVGGRARGDISVIAPRSARSAFVMEMPATARGTASRRSADPFALPPGGIWRARAPVRTPVLLNNHDPRTAAVSRRADSVFPPGGKISMRIDPASPVGDVSFEPGYPLGMADSHGDKDTGNARPVDLNSAANGDRPQLTVVIPPRPGEHGVAELVERLGPEVAPMHAEIIVVLDGDGMSLDALAFSAQMCPVPVRLLCLPRAGRGADRSQAVLAGTRHARGAWVLVMNAGPQHPPNAAVVLASTALRHNSDIVVDRKSTRLNS